MTRKDVLRARLGDGPSNDWDVDSIDWPALNEDSVVVEIGAYKGRWARLIYDLYQSKMFLFEPQDWAFSILREVMNDTGAKLFDYALGLHNTSAVLGDYGRDGASLLKPNHSDKHAIYMRNIREAFNDLSLNKIDLCLMNIEGYEFELIPYMNQAGLMARIDTFVVQMHGEPDSPERFNTLQTLGRTHDVIWNYGIVLSAWKLRK